MIRLCPLETMITRCDVAGLRVPEVLQEKSQVAKDYHGKSAGWYILNAWHVSCYDFFFFCNFFCELDYCFAPDYECNPNCKAQGNP